MGELEQPLATRLHWTKGRNMTQSDKLSKKKNTNNLKTTSLLRLWRVYLAPKRLSRVFFLWTEPTNQCPKIIIVTLLSFLTVTTRGTLDFKALYVILCVYACVLISIMVPNTNSQ